MATLTLDAVSRELLRAYPLVEQVVAVESYRPGYAPYPALVTMRLRGGSLTTGVLKVSSRADLIAREASVLRALNELGLPVPTVLAGPLETQDGCPRSGMVLLSELPGGPLPWIGLNDLARAYRTCQLLSQAVDRLHSMTSGMLALPIAVALPSTTLESELSTIVARGGLALGSPVVDKAVTLLERALPHENARLVFSNGDYNPLNFMVVNDRITGFLDFEHACFEDPFIGLAKFLLWADDGLGWGAGAKAGLVERYLYEHDVDPRSFLLRLMLRGLTHIQDTPPNQSVEYMLGVIGDAVNRFDGKTATM